MIDYKYQLTLSTPFVKGIQYRVQIFCIIEIYIGFITSNMVLAFKQILLIDISICIRKFKYKKIKQLITSAHAADSDDK